MNGEPRYAVVVVGTGFGGTLTALTRATPSRSSLRHTPIRGVEGSRGSR
ncbi:MAG TPA: hypothetical protein VF486_25775 [Actinomycetes bacterium]